MRKQEPVIVIGLDGAEYSLIQKWCREGCLPTIASLIENGCWGLVNSTGDLCSGTVWPSVITGLSPLKHGVFFGHKEYDPGSYTIYRKYADRVEGTQFWHWLSYAGKRVAIFDIPRTYPLDELNGLQVVSWGSFASDYNASSVPPGLIDDLIARFGTHPLSGWYERRPVTAEDHEDLFNKLVSGIEKRGVISDYLSELQPWDILFTTFSETHWSGHLLWHLLDKQHPFYNPSLSEICDSFFLDLYISIDRIISGIVRKFPAATVIIFSPEGMGSNYSGNHLLPQILDRLGFNATSKDRKPCGFVSRITREIKNIVPSRRWGRDATREFEALIPLRVIEALKRTVPGKIWDSLVRHLLYSGNNWGESKAFVIPGEFSGAIRVNLKGREPTGIVEPGVEYDKFCDEIVQKLSILKNHDTGNTAVKEVVRVDRLFKTDNIKHFPDIVVKWKGDCPVRKLSSPHVDIVSGDSHEVRSGAHRRDGFIIARGIGISKGKTIAGADIKDISATILYIMGVDVPSEMEGKILMDMFQ